MALIAQFEPSALPCAHVFCLPCLQESLQADRHFYPKCRTDVPPNFKPTLSHNVK